MVLQRQWMYNLTVDIAHTSFVGDQQRLMHSACRIEGRPDLYRGGNATSMHSYLAQLSDPQPEKQEKAVRALGALGETALPCLIGALEMGEYRQAWPRIMQIIQQMYSPKRLSAVPVLMRFLRDGNKPSYGPAFRALLQMGESVVVNAHDILAYNWSDESWIQGVCALLEDMDSVSLDILIPELLHLFEIGTDENHLAEHVLGPLCKMGSPKANAAVSLLIDKIRSKGSEHIRRLSIEALQDFEYSAVRPYVPILRECLSDERDAIRISAQKVLQTLGEFP